MQVNRAPVAGGAVGPWPGGHAPSSGGQGGEALRDQALVGRHEVGHIGDVSRHQRAVGGDIADQTDPAGEDFTRQRHAGATQVERDVEVAVGPGRAVPRATEPNTKPSRGGPAAWQASIRAVCRAAGSMARG